MKNKLERIIVILLFVSFFQINVFGKKIEFSVLKDKIAGAWIGQMVGNIYGLPYENKFIDEPGDQKNWPWGYDKSLKMLEKYNGAFSDDDTDFEYIYLMLMEKYGAEPSYEEIREGWMYHVRDRVWLANRATLGLMHYGFTPPYTGYKEYNPHWYQIDPQLINEIWAYTAPGMVKYASDKSAWAARITSDSWGISPTIHYGAMYSMAFFETDIKKLILDAVKYLPNDDRYAQTVLHMVDLYEKYPNSWQDARSELADKYYVNEDEMTKTIWNANLNGACGVLSMLYGEGDWQRTMDIGVSLGYDADNQTATVGGLLGVMYGMKPIPESLSNPFGTWSKPFNDRYINITRYDMPDASIEDMVNRTFEIAVKLACENGGEVITEGNKKYLQINTKAEFNPPLEFGTSPMPRMEVNKVVDYSFSNESNKNNQWLITTGTLPEGLKFNNGQITGTPLKAGKYPLTLALSNQSKTIRKQFTLLVRTNNIAVTADSILTNVRELNEEVLFKSWITFGKPLYAKSVDVINDGVLNGEGSVFYSLASESKIPKIDYFGYQWNEKKNINMIALHTGSVEEFGGWFSSMNIQYLGEDNKWHDVGGFTSTPELPKNDIVFFQPHFVEYIFEFKPVYAKAIRVIGDTKVQEHWNKDTKNTSSFFSITELSVYEF